MTGIRAETPTASSAWYALPAAVVTGELDVDPRVGLTTDEAGRRLDRQGPNQLAETEREPRWRAFLRQFQDLMIIVLVVAAAVSLVVSRDWETPIAIAVVVLLNATIGSSRSRRPRPRSRRCGR
jgi:Ca2+-transporting ATPase